MPPPADSVLALIGNTPLVQLARVGKDLPVPLLGKCEFLNPGGSGKDRIARAIIEHGEKKGQLRRGDTIIEATAGNTGIGLALMAAVKGYRLVCVLPEKMSQDKRLALAALGAELMITPNVPPHDPNHFQQVARRMAEEKGWFLTDQFTHFANPWIHEQTTGPEILQQCGGNVGAFVAGIGTGGTITGVGRFLKKYCPHVQIVLADPVGSRLAHMINPEQPDFDGAYQVEGIGGSVAPVVLDLSVIDSVERVTDADSFAMTARLMREEGLLVGGSSGTAVVAAHRIASTINPRGPVVVLLADSWDRYYSKPWMQALASDKNSRPISSSPEPFRTEFESKKSS